MSVLNHHLYVWAKYSWVVIRWAAEVVGQCAAAVRGWAQSLLFVGPQLAWWKYPRCLNLAGKLSLASTRRPQLGWHSILEKIPQPQEGTVSIKREVRITWKFGLGWRLG